MTMIDPTCGSAVLIEFERNGKPHRAIRWCSDETMVDELIEGGCLDRLRKDFAALGAEILKIAKIETSQICCGDC